jgi:hypothetical protein
MLIYVAARKVGNVSDERVIVRALMHLVNPRHPPTLAACQLLPVQRARRPMRF